jgi:hypothetical protein
MMDGFNGTNGDVVVGVFRERTQAENALHELHAAGFTEDDTGVVVRGKKDPGDDDSAIENDATLEESSTGSGVLAGGTIGGVIGAAATALIPGVGPVLAAGLLAGAAAAGGVAGGVIGTLEGIGVPRDDAKFYEQEFNDGRPIITVKAADRKAEAWQILKKNGAYDAHTRPESD